MFQPILDQATNATGMTVDIDNLWIVMGVTLIEVRLPRVSVKVAPYPKTIPSVLLIYLFYY